MNPPKLSRSHCKGGGGEVKGGDPCGRPRSHHISSPILVIIVGAGNAWMKGGDPCGRPPASYLTRAIVGAGAVRMMGGGACAALGVGNATARSK